MQQIIPDTGVNVQFVFRDFAREFRATIPADNLEFLERLELVLYATSESSQGYGAHDLRIHVNGRDITPAVRAQLVDQLEHLAGFGASYAAAMTRWLSYRAAFGVLPEWLEAQRNQARELAQRPARDLLGTLGDKDSGDHGHLDVFNFLFREIPLQPVDVRPMLLPAELKQPIVFIISSGPSWSLHPNTWTPDQSHGHGAVSFSARAVFNNPLEARVAAIQAEVTNALRALATRISSVSDIQQNIRNTLDQLATRVDDCTQAVGDPAIVAGIRRAVEDIKRALNIP